MPRILLCFAAIAAFALPCRAEQTSSDSETLIRLNVMPAPAPKPALRYQLLPELKEMNPGNPIQHYMKMMMEQQTFFFDKEAFQRREKLLAMPLEGAARAGAGGLRPVRAESGRLGRPARQSRLADPAEAEGRRDPTAASRSAADARPGQGCFRCGFGPRSPRAASTTPSEPPRRCSPCRATWASTRRSSATWWGSRSLRWRHRPLEEMLEQPGCPNLYWALTNLPSPLIPLDKGMDGERVMHPWVFRDLDDSAPMSADQLKKFIASLDKQLGLGEGTPPSRACGRGWTRGPRTSGGQRRPPPPRRERPPGGAAAAVPGRPGDPPGREAGVGSALRRRHENHELSRLAGRSVGCPDNKLKKPPALFADDCWCRSRQRPPGAGAAGPADRASATRRGAATLRRRAQRHAARETVRDSRAAARSTRSPASRSATRSPATRRTSAAVRLRARKRMPRSTSITR